MIRQFEKSSKVTTTTKIIVRKQGSKKTSSTQTKNTTKYNTILRVMPSCHLEIFDHLRSSSSSSNQPTETIRAKHRAAVTPQGWTGGHSHWRIAERNMEHATLDILGEHLLTLKKTTRFYIILAAPTLHLITV